MTQGHLKGCLLVLHFVQVIKRIPGRVQADFPAAAVDLPDHLCDGALLSVKNDPISQLIGAIREMMFAHTAPARPEKERRSGADSRFRLQPAFIAMQWILRSCVPYRLCNIRSQANKAAGFSQLRFGCCEISGIHPYGLPERIV